MLKQLFVFLFIFVILFCNNEILFAQKKAVTDDGKIVILNADGTWQYANDDDTKNTIKKYTFRDTNWGMSKAQVKTSEKNEIIKEDENLLAYSSTISGLDAWILYIFVSNKLVRSKYAVIEEHSNTNDFISDYKNLQEVLQKKYGKPIKDDRIWKKDLYKDDYQRWGFAISLGDLIYISRWETPETDIALILYGENYKVSLAIEYSSKKLQALEEKEKQKKNMDQY